MAKKTDFTADEWKTILASPMLAGMAVTLAEPSGLWGMLQEGMASGRGASSAPRYVSHCVADAVASGDQEKRERKIDELISVIDSAT